MSKRNAELFLPFTEQEARDMLRLLEFAGRDEASRFGRLRLKLEESLRVYAESAARKSASSRRAGKP